MKEKLIRFKEKLNNSKFNLPVRNILLAIVINLIVEMFSRRSAAEGLIFVVTRPLQFIYGVIVVLFTFSFCVLVKRRIFTKTLVCGLWIVCGVVNFVVTKFRHTPFTAQDFHLIKYAYTVAPVYLTTFQMILIAVLLVLFVAAMVVWWFKAPKLQEKINYFRSLVVVLSFWFAVWGITKLGVTFGVLAQNFGNIGSAYDEYGFAYCFSNSLFNSGIDKPKDYNEDAINAILEKIEQYERERDEARKEQNKQEQNQEEIRPTGEPESSKNRPAGDENESGVGGQGSGETQMPPRKPDQTGQGGPEDKPEIQDIKPSKEYPNIIFLQLESLFDPQLLKEAEFSDTVLPNLTELYEKYPSGFLSVPSVGAGTANTEFEIISGMNLDDFGPGEYPYKTVLMHKACESICFDLKKYGYMANAVHNNDGTFYDRNEVFSQLGFDTFTSVEYMDDLEYNELGWARDRVLTDEIMEILGGTEQRDFIYTISVQGHGDYPADYTPKEGDILVSGEGVKAYLNQLTYYTNQIHEMDQFVGGLISALEKAGEPTVLVMYGDHLPAFDIEDTDLKEGNTFTTQYAVWNNFELDNIKEDIEAFQLTSHVLDMLGIEGGAISKYHSTIRRVEEQEQYLEGLKILEYDILYGDRDVYGGVLPYSRTNLRMGHKDITVDNVSNAGDHVIIQGHNFTPYSYVTVNGEYVEAIYSDSSVLLIDGVSLKEGDSVAVVQKGKDGIKLSSTSLYIFGRSQETQTSPK